MGAFIAAAPNAIRERRARVKLDRIVIHTMEGSLSGSITWFRNPDREVATAAHYLIGTDGRIVQMVPDDKKALHAGNYNDRSIGIEHEGYAAKPGGFTPALLSASAKVVAILCRKYAIPVDRDHVVGHSEIPGATHTDPGDGWPWGAYMALVRSYTPPA